ncbi:hypothetical protein B9Z55_004919 [Caenorhabditis nigoni]|uniref:Integrase catalytic domain-containing protein n=2 Tax=Caenorhabditis nigoni TaxID=1611254 RepID=A0A2G5UYM6_9PELO|nr:hypothetical protein B9Z55_004919 [Caenorhabditis nigoni]
MDTRAAVQLMGKMPEKVREKCAKEYRAGTITIPYILKEAEAYLQYQRADRLVLKAAAQLNPNQKPPKGLAGLNHVEAGFTTEEESDESRDEEQSESEEADVFAFSGQRSKHQKGTGNNHKGSGFNKKQYSTDRSSDYSKQKEVMQNTQKQQFQQIPTRFQNQQNQFSQQSPQFQNRQQFQKPWQGNTNQSQQNHINFQSNGTPDCPGHASGPQMTFQEATRTPIEDSPIKHIFRIGPGPMLDCIKNTFPKEQQNPEHHCPIHGQGHKLIHCRLSSSNVRSFFVMFRRCANCGSSRHSFRECQSLVKCFYCGAKHNTAGCVMKEYYRDYRNFPTDAEPPYDLEFFQADNSQETRHKAEQVNTIVAEQISEDEEENQEKETPDEPEVLTPSDLAGRETVYSKEFAVNHIVHCLQSAVFNPTPLETTPDDITLPFAVLHTAAKQPILTLVDSGASISLISKDTAEKLKLKKTQEVDLTVNAYGAKHKCVSNIYEIVFQGEGSYYSTYVASVPELPKTKFEVPKFNQADKAEIGRHGIDIADIMKGRRYKQKHIELILGNDIIPQFIKESYRIFLPSGKYIEVTPFAKITYPNAKHCPIMDLTKTPTLQIAEHEEEINAIWADSQELEKAEEVAELLQQMYRVENLGVEAIEELESNKTNQETFLTQFEESLVTNPAGEIEVALPWNGKQERMGNNRQLAYRRLLQLIDKLKQREDLTASFEKIISEQLEAGIIEKVTPEMQNDGPEYVAPQNAVFKADSTNTKVRIVGDLSSHQKGKLSVNDCLHDGPNLLKKVPGLFLRHRISRFSITADIAKAFHQVRLQKKDRNATKWFWVKNIHAPPAGDNLIEYRFTRIPFGMRCSPFLLAATIRHYLQMSKDAISREIELNLYVDNIMVTTDDPQEVAIKVQKVKKEFAKMNMNVREFASNKQEVINKLPIEDRAESHRVKFLGYVWDTTADTLAVKIPEPKQGHPTKRDVASFLGKMYDPMGYNAPLHVKLKRFTQKAWNNKIEWKEKIPAKMLKEWEHILSQYKDKEISIPRKLRQTYRENQKPEMVVFCDASKHTYACAVYLIYRNEDGTVERQLIGAKSKVRPAAGSGWSIPRLELLAVEIGIRFAESLIAELPENHKPTHLDVFTDSIIALYWILTNEQKKAWVHNRVKTIYETNASLRQLNMDIAFHHVRTDENPADLATRGMNSTDLQKCRFWFEGPTFLDLPRTQWSPKLEGEIECPAEMMEDVMAELQNGVKTIRKKAKKVTITHLTPARETFPSHLFAIKQEYKKKQKAEQAYESPIPYAYTNDLSKLATITGIVLRFISRMAEKAKIKLTNPILRAHRNAEHVQDAVDRAIRKRQLARQLIILEHYKESESRGFSFKESLRPYQSSDGLLRRKRNIESPVLPMEASEPILIHSEHILARMIVLETHRRNVHLPANYLIAAIRTQYWIRKDGNLARSVISSCVQCRKVKEFPFKYPYTENMHSSRLTPSIPFGRAGLDYAGPIEHRIQGSDTKEKAYILIYTCLTTRCTHLEVVPDNTAVSYVTALESIFSQRGVPQYIYSDNARTFRLGHDIINSNIEAHQPSSQLVKLLADKSVNFRYITPLSPWQGGVYERIVGITKKQLRKEIGRTTLTFFQLHSVIKRVEGIINSRPLTRSSKESNDVPTIRPIDFLLPAVLLEVPNAAYNGEDINPFQPPTVNQTEAETRQHLQKLDQVLAKIWSTWASSYLLMQRENAERNERFSRVPPKVGQIVLVSTEKVTRPYWPLGRIVKVNGKPGQIRTVEVLFEGAVKARAVNQLIPLEIDPDYEQVNEAETPIHQVVEKTYKPPGVPKVPHLKALPQIQNSSSNDSRQHSTVKETQPVTRRMPDRAAKRHGISYAEQSDSE